MGLHLGGMPNELTPALAEEIRSRLATCVARVAHDFGLELVVERNRLDGADASVGFACKLKAPAVGGVPREQFEFERDASRYGLGGADYMALFEAGGVEYRLVGVGSGVYPLRGRRVSDGRVVLFGDWVLDQLRAAVVAGS